MSNLVTGRISEEVHTILVVEDEYLLRRLICDELTEAGLTVIAAGSGDEALRILSAGTVVDLVLTDVRMPGETGGLELAEAVSTSAAQLPVIVMSGEPSAQVVSGRFPFLLKPFPMEQMVEEVRAALPPPPMRSHQQAAAVPRPADGKSNHQGRRSPPPGAR